MWDRRHPVSVGFDKKILDKSATVVQRKAKGQYLYLRRHQKRYWSSALPLGIAGASIQVQINGTSSPSADVAASLPSAGRAGIRTVRIASPKDSASRLVPSIMAI